MRNLTYYVGASADGFIAGPDDEVDAFGFDGDFAAWIVAEYPETLPVHARSALGLEQAPAKHFDTVLMGRRTFEPALRVGLASAYPHLRQLVFSQTLPADQPGVEVVATDPAVRVAELKAADGAGIWLCGGASLAASLTDQIDEVVIKRQPVVLGAGIPLLAGPYRPWPLQLTELTRFETGVVVERYRVS